MKNTFGIATFVLLAAAAVHAAAEFPYYPEYADVFSQYDEVTPVLAKKYGMRSPPPGAGAGAYVCEPVLMRDVAGMPKYYELAFYTGEEAYVAAKWNEIVTTINARRKVSASEIGAKLKFFEGEEVLWKFKGCEMSAYTFGCGMLRAGGVPRAFGGYNEAYEKATSVLKSRDLLFTRLMSGDVLHARVFEFESRSGKTVAVGVPYFPSNGYATEVVDLKLLAELAKITARGFHRSVAADPPHFEEVQKGWKRLDESIPDEVAAQELPRVGAGNLADTERAEP